MNKSYEKLKILILSPQINARSGIRKNLLDLGFNIKLIEVATEYPQAKTMLEQVGFNIVIADDDLGKYSALDLIELQRKTCKKPHERIFIYLHSGEASPFVTADFLLKGGDLILPKPYKQDVLIKAVSQLVEEKEKIKGDANNAILIEDALLSSNIDLAKELFSKFQDSDSYYFYYSKGLIETFDQNLDEAFDSLNVAVGLSNSLNSISKATLLGIKIKRYTETLPLLESWISQYPLQLQSIPDFVRLLIACQDFALIKDILSVLDLYKTQDESIRFP